MQMMICRRLLFGASLLLATGNAQATPIDDCNQSADGDLQIQACTRLLRLDPFGPNAALAYGLRGEAYKNKGELDRAITDFSSAITVDPKAFNIYVNRGIAYREKGDLDLALADFNKAIEINGNFAEAFINRCVVYEDKGQYDLAIADCARAITLSPEEAVAYNDRGVAYDKKGTSTAPSLTTPRRSRSIRTLETPTPTALSSMTIKATGSEPSPITARRLPGIPSRKTRATSGMRSSASTPLRSSYTSRLCSTAASMKEANSGCGSKGRDFSSGWNCTPTNQGWSGNLDDLGQQAVGRDAREAQARRLRAALR